MKNEREAERVGKQALFAVSGVFGLKKRSKNMSEGVLAATISGISAIIVAWVPFIAIKLSGKNKTAGNEEIEQNDLEGKPEQAVTFWQKKMKTYVGFAICISICGLLTALVPNILAIVRSQNMKPLSFITWQTWGSINDTKSDNTVTLNGMVYKAGYHSEALDTSLKGKIVVLEIENADASVFRTNALIKIMANKTNTLVKPKGINTFILDGYIPIGYDRIEFPLPSDFDGKLEFTFHEVTLNNLKITAYLK